MANTIHHAGHHPRLENAGPASKKRPAAGADRRQDIIRASLGADKDFSLSLSDTALSHAARRPQADTAAASGQQGVRPEEEQLSAKAKDYLAKLREQYGDYDFSIADDVQNPLDVTGPSNKKYFVVLSSEEIERMADDKDFAQEVMGKVESAIGTLNKVQEQGLLGEGVRFSRLAISFDADGNTKLFAELERMSEEQQQRLEKAKAKRAEEKKAAAKEPRPPLPDDADLRNAIKNRRPPHHPPLESILRLLQHEETKPAAQAEGQAGQQKPHGRHHHPVHHTPKASATPPPATHTVRIEAGSVEELLDKAQQIEW